MSKTPEQYVEYALKHFSEHHKTAGRIVQELRAAGWLREANEIPHVVALEGYKRTVEQLTRERDEARTNAAQAVGQLDLAQRERDEARVDREAWARAYRRALASAASPEVVRVVEAAKAWRDKVWSATFITDYERALRAAVDALSASRQPKAQERYFVGNGTEVYSQDPMRVNAIRAQFYGPDAKARAEAECARLNGEGGGK